MSVKITEVWENSHTPEQSAQQETKLNEMIAAGKLVPVESKVVQLEETGEDDVTRTVDYTVNTYVEFEKVTHEDGAVTVHSISKVFVDDAAADEWLAFASDFGTVTITKQTV